jgi:natural product precursor
MKKRNPKKLTLNRESIIRLDPSNLRDVVGGVTRLCTNTDDCTDSCAPYSVC